MTNKFFLSSSAVIGANFMPAIKIFFPFIEEKILQFIHLHITKMVYGVTKPKVWCF